MTAYQLEVAVETPEDAVTAQAGKADRVELSAALDLGGLTPSAGLVEEVAAATKLPVWVMLRPRPGDFVYSAAEFRVMRRDAAHLAKLNPAGVVFGILTEDGQIDVARCAELIAACGRPCVFHRAFDRCVRPADALDDAVKLGFVRILTSGRESTALAGSTNIAKLRQHAAGRIELLPCGKVRSANAETVLRATGCTQLHASFAEAIPDAEEVGRRGYPTRTRVGYDEVCQTRAVLDRVAAKPGPV